jgi:hypothetical protein
MKTKMTVEKLDQKFKRLSQKHVDALPVGTKVFVKYPGEKNPREYKIDQRIDELTYINSCVGGCALLFIGKEHPLTIVWADS